MNTINKNLFSFSPLKIKRNKTAVIKHKNDKSNTNNQRLILLSKEERKKLYHIIKKFKKHKITTNGLFEKEKKMPLNSVNKGNFMFLFNDEEEKNKNKNKNKIKLAIQHKKKKMVKFSKFEYTLLASLMMNKFNHKTSSILDYSTPKSAKFSKNIFSFRNKIINCFTDQEKYKEGMVYSKINYEDALDVIDENEDNKFKKNLKKEEQFYQLKNNKIGVYEIDLDKEDEFSKTVPRFKSFKNLSNYQFYFGKNIDNKFSNKTKNKNFIKNRSSSPKINNNLKINLKSSKKVLNNLLDKTKKILTKKNKNYNIKSDDDKNNNQELKNNYITIEINSNENTSHSNIFNNITVSTDRTNYFSEKKTKESINLFKDYNNSKKNNKKSNKSINKSSDNNLSTKQNMNKSERVMIEFMKKYWNFQKNKIIEKSKRLANSMAQMNFFKYKPKEYVDYKNATMNINSQNLTRVIKLIRMNKYLCDLEDDDLMVMDSKKLQHLMKEAEINYYSCNKKDFQLSYLRKNLRPQTINKFCSIKNSFFGLPC